MPKTQPRDVRPLAVKLAAIIIESRGLKPESESLLMRIVRRYFENELSELKGAADDDIPF